ncbi:ribonuclease H-like domain-containing protein [Tanacetum coccineum]
MEAVSSPMVAAAKLPVLNPGEFELWKMRIEQYFLMTDYALWEVIVNGDSPPPKRTIDGVEQTYPPTTAEEKLASSNQAHGSNSANTDSIKKMDLKWQMAMLTMRARRYLNKTRRKISANGSETIWFNKSKVECYNCHKRGHFAREYRALRENRNRKPVRRNVTVETTETKALVAQDGLGYDWSDHAKEGPTNFALMAYTSSSSSSSDSEVSTSSKACLESVKARLDVYKKNEVVFEEDIKILKLDIMLRDNALTDLRKKFEKAEKEKDDLKLTLEKFENSSKNLSKLLEIQVSDKFKTSVGYDSQVIDSQVFDSQVNDKYKTGEGYHAVPTLYTRNFMPPKPNLVLADEEEYVFSELITSVHVVATSKVKTRIDKGLGSPSGIRAFALTNFNLQVMEFESAHSNTTAKLHILKLGEYEMWIIRIKQYFQVQDYALWEVIENGNSWVSVPQTAQENGTSVTRMSVPVTAEEKTNKKNDVKARSLILMALPNEHQLTFSQYTNAKTMFTAIETRFGDFKRLLVGLQFWVWSSFKDLNSKFLRSLPPEWNTHVVVWMNKAKIKTMSIDDLYNNFKIVKQSVKKSVGASSGAQNLAFMTAPSTSSTNDVNTAKPAYEVSTVSPNVNTASPQVSTASFSDNVVYAFMLSLLSMRAKRYFQRTRKKIFINANDTVGYDKSKVECFNCHKMGHFARECRAPRNKEGQFKYQDNTRKQGNNEDTSSKAMLAIDGVGFDWSGYAKE